MGVSSSPHGSRICIFFGITLRRNPTRDPSTREPTVEAAALPASTARSSILNSAVTSSQNCRPGGRYGELRRGLWMGGPGFEGGVRDLFEYPRVVLMVDNALQHNPDPAGVHEWLKIGRLQRMHWPAPNVEVLGFPEQMLRELLKVGGRGDLWCRVEKRALGAAATTAVPLTPLGSDLLAVKRSSWRPFALAAHVHEASAQRACGQRATAKVATFDSKGLVNSAPEQGHVAPRKIREEFLRRQLLLAEDLEDL